MGAAPAQGIGAPPAGTIEALLSTLPERQYIVAAEPLAAALASAGDELEQRAGSAGNSTYFALDPSRVGGTDALVFLERIGPASGDLVAGDA